MFTLKILDSRTCHVIIEREHGASVMVFTGEYCNGAPFFVQEPALVMKCKKTGFSLVELFVVIAIISLLTAMLTPSLIHARELAKRVLCASNLHNIATAVTNYYSDNRKQLMCSATQMSGTAMPTSIMRQHDPSWSSHKWFWNIESINPYIDAFDENDSAPGGIFICPSAEPDFWHEHFANELGKTNLTDADKLIQTPYAYYARVGNWNTCAVQNGAQNDLTDRTPQSDRLLMSDHIWLHWDTRRLTYNHGRSGPALPDNQKEAPGDLTGINHLYGDGHASWKSVDQMYPQDMGSFWSYPTGYINDGGANDTFFY